MGIRISNDDFLWRGGKLPFRLDAAALGPAAVINVNAAITAWNVGVPFLQLTPRDGEANFADFVPQPGGEPCGSPVGMRGGRQEIQCGASADSIMHEIGHAAGLWHEQSRQDRDSFVTILYDNIDPMRRHNFEKHIGDGTDLGSYDYGSLMHYGSNAFAEAPGLFTIVAPAGKVIGAATTLSAGDLAALQLIYQGRAGWIRMGGGLKHISTGSANTQWGVSIADSIHRRNGNVWNVIPGSLKQVSVASDGTVWGVNSLDRIFRRDGDSWTRISGSLRYVSVGANTNIWGVNSDGKIYFRDVAGDTWVNVSGELNQISVASDGATWGVNSSRHIFRR